MTSPFPTRKELEDKLLKLQSREVLGAHEVLTVVQTLVTPHLKGAEHDVANLAWYANLAAVHSALGELGRIIQLEEQALSNLIATGDANDQSACEQCFRREAGLKLMRLLHGTRIHNDIATV